MNKFSVGFIFLVLLISCTKSKSNESLISNTNVNFKISRFEQQFYTSNKKTLPKLMGEYPYLFPTKNDSIWLAKIKNEHNLFLKTQQVFKDFSSEKNELIDVLKHLKYYFPKFKSPHFITLITNLDYDNKIIYADSLCFISLDLYLGKNSKVYNDFPTYLKQNYNPNQIQVDVAKSIVRKLHRPYRSNLFLNEMINKGKDLYVVRAIVPKVQIEKIMGYSKEQWNWAKANELPIWTYFVDKELLFSSKSNLRARFIEDAPFSKFYLDIDRESPGKIGAFVGWQIVNAYMNNNHVTLQQLLQTNAETIYSKSKYKPEKNGDRSPF